MDAASVAVILAPITTLLGTLVGYWIAGRNDEARDQRAAARETASRRTALAERLEEDRHTFQRDTLLELQDEVQHLARITTRILLQDERTLRQQGQLLQLPEGMSDQAFHVATSVQRLRARVLDPELREAVGSFVEITVGSSLETTARASRRRPENTDRLLIELTQQEIRVSKSFESVNDLLGELLRRELDRRFLAIEPSQDREPPVGGGS